MLDSRCRPSRHRMNTSLLSTFRTFDAKKFGISFARIEAPSIQLYTYRYRLARRFPTEKLMAAITIHAAPAGLLAASAIPRPPCRYFVMPPSPVARPRRLASQRQLADMLAGVTTPARGFSP